MSERDLLGRFLCVWGRECGTEDDAAACDRVAVGIVAVRDGSRFHKLKVCGSHRLALVAETSAL